MGKNIEGANVTINVGNVTAVSCEDMGDGIYQGIIDTSNISPDSYRILITAKKSGYADASTSFTLTIRWTIPDFYMIGIVSTIGAFALIGVIFALKRGLLSK